MHGRPRGPGINALVEISGQEAAPSAQKAVVKTSTASESWIMEHPHELPLIIHKTPKHVVQDHMNHVVGREFWVANGKRWAAFLLTRADFVTSVLIREGFTNQSLKRRTPREKQILIVRIAGIFRMEFFRYSRDESWMEDAVGDNDAWMDIDGMCSWHVRWAIRAIERGGRYVSVTGRCESAYSSGRRLPDETYDLVKSAALEVSRQQSLQVSHETSQPAVDGTSHLAPSPVSQQNKVSHSQASSPKANQAPHQTCHPEFHNGLHQARPQILPQVPPPEPPQALPQVSHQAFYQSPQQTSSQQTYERSRQERHETFCLAPDQASPQASHQVTHPIAHQTAQQTALQALLMLEILEPS
ncbi:hypothetical protein B0J14DRAFT_555038 [Halenospora varia]|nr:hypothetical protein B0J14DRAFT_555038 [Halenospora varia]